MVLRLLGDIAAYADPPDPESAKEHYHQALAMANELGMRSHHRMSIWR